MEIINCSPKRLDLMMELVQIYKYPQNKVINGVNIPIIVSSIGEENLLPNEIQLYQNYPNPFNPTTKIGYSIPSNVGSRHASTVQLKVYDILGNEVATLVNEHKEPGYYEIEFDTRNLASGVYIYRLTSGNPSSSQAKDLIQQRR